MIKGKSIVKSNQSKPKGLSVGFNEQGFKKSNKPGAPKFGAGKQFKQKGPGPAPKTGAPKGGKFAAGKPSAKPSKKQPDEDEDEFDEDEEGDFEDLNEDDFDEEDDDDDDEDDVEGEDDDLEDMGDEDADDKGEDEDEPTSKKAKGGKAQTANAKGKAAPAAQNAKQNKQQQVQAKPLRQAQKDNQKAEATTKPAQTVAARESAAKKPSVPAAFAPGRGAPAKNDAEDRFWESVAKMAPLTPEQAKRVDDSLSSEGKRILFVKNIPQEITASQIKALSSDILTVRIPSAADSRKKHKKHAKFAFVEFASEALAQKNIAVIGRASFAEGQTLHAALARGGDGDDRSMRASDWKVGLLFVGGINPSAPGGGGDPTGSETALTARQAATEKAVRALLPTSDEVLVPINTTSLQLRGFAFVRFNDAQKAIAAFDDIKKKAIAGQPPMLFGSKVFVSLAREKHHEKQQKTPPTQPQAAKLAAQTPPTTTSTTADVKATPKSKAPQQVEVLKEDESSAKRARLTSGGSVASTGSASGQKSKSLLGSPAVAATPASPAVGKPLPATPKTATPQGKQQPQQTSGKKEQAPPAKKQELAKGKGTPTATGKANKQGAQQAAAKSKQAGLQKAGAKRPLDEDDDDDDEDDWVDEDEDAEGEDDDDEGDE